MISFITKVKLFLFTYDWEVVEIQGAVFKIAWGLWLLLPFATFKTIQGYNSAGTENYWGIGLLIYGLLHFVAIISGNRPWRRWMTFGAFCFWLFTVFLIYQQSSTAASILPLFAIIAFFMGLNFIRIGKMPVTMRTIINSVDERKEDIGPPPGIPERRANHD